MLTADIANAPASPLLSMLALPARASAGLGGITMALICLARDSPRFWLAAAGAAAPDSEYDQDQPEHARGGGQRPLEHGQPGHP
jgi:hypothetical protein